MINRLPRLTSLALSTTLTHAALTTLRAKASGGPSWRRKNYAGRSVDLYAGPATALATTLSSARIHPAAALAIAAAGACGAYDDIAGAADPRRGFRAHLTALRDGEVTSGAVKLFGISIAALLAGAVLKEKALDKVLAGVVTAGAAHFVNLVDVRPGRAAAVVIGLGVPGMLRKGPGGELAAAAVGAAAAVLPGDLGEWSMLGDTGAHALGAVLGVAVAVGNGRAGLVAHAAAVVAAAVCGDRVTGVARRVRGQWCRGFGPWGGFGGFSLV